MRECLLELHGMIEARSDRLATQEEGLNQMIAARAARFAREGEESTEEANEVDTEATEEAAQGHLVQARAAAIIVNLEQEQEVVEWPTYGPLSSSARAPALEWMPPISAVVAPAIYLVPPNSSASAPAIEWLPPCSSASAPDPGASELDWLLKGAEELQDQGSKQGVDRK